LASSLILITQPSQLEPTFEHMESSFSERALD